MPFVLLLQHFTFEFLTSNRIDKIVINCKTNPSTEHLFVEIGIKPYVYTIKGASYTRKDV